MEFRIPCDVDLTMVRAVYQNRKECIVTRIGWGSFLAWYFFIHEKTKAAVNDFIKIRFSRGVKYFFMEQILKLFLFELHTAIQSKSRVAFVSND